MKLSDIVTDVFSGGTPNTQKPEYWDGGLPWLSSGETRSRVITATEKTITDLGVDESSTRKALKGDIVIASAGQGATRGRVSLLMIDTYINQSVIAVRCDPLQVDSMWLFYNLYNRYDELRRLSDANSSRGSITTKLIRDLDVQLPSLEEQRAVSRAISVIEEKMLSNQRMNEILEKTAQLLFRAIFDERAIINAKVEAIAANENPDAVASQVITGKLLDNLPPDIASKVLHLVRIFPSQVNQEGVPVGWR